MKKKSDITIRSSVAEYLTYIAATGDDSQSFEMRYEDGTIRKFRIVQTEGSRQVNREVKHYNLQSDENGISIEINEDCNTSQFYGYIEPILSKIWDNPDDEIYNDI